MLSAKFKIIPVDSVVVDRDSRQRRELKDIDTLAESISRLGLINPITIERGTNRLIAGERRLTAIRSLGYDSIAVQFADDLSEHELRAIELEENVKRLDIPWQDQCRAVEEYHSLRVGEALETGTPWTQTDTANALGLTPASVTQNLAVAKELRKGNELVVNAPKFSVARNVAQRQKERAAASEKAAVMEKVGLKEPEKPKLIIQADFREWARTYEGPPFNLIHCDFPYGIGADTFDQGGASQHGGYEDSFENYERLLETLGDCGPDQHGIIDESAHLIFWFSMKHYEFTKKFLRNIGWTVDDFPLIWHRSDNAGILPDPNRGPRRTYETAFFGSRGDRKIVRAVANSFSHSTVRERHMSEKPQPMLEHFFRMVVDEHTRLLDPTAGSGSAIRAGRSLGATSVLGLEINPEYVERALLAIGG